VIKEKLDIALDAGRVEDSLLTFAAKNQTANRNAFRPASIFREFPNRRVASSLVLVPKRFERLERSPAVKRLERAAVLSERSG
jgi:hypothetical protein